MDLVELHDVKSTDCGQKLGSSNWEWPTAEKDYLDRNCLETLLIVKKGTRFCHL